MGAGLSLAGGVMGTYVAARVNLRKSYQEKWWALKCEAYSRIVESLHHAAHCLNQWSDQDMQEMQEGWHFTPEKTKQLADDFAKATREIEVATGVGAYIISNEVAKALADLSFKVRETADDEGLPNFERYWNDSKKYKDALEKVRVLAIKDLTVR